MKFIQLKDRKISFYGDAGLEVDPSQRRLVFTKVADSAVLVTPFDDRFYFILEKFLFIVDDNDMEDIALIFADNENAQKVFAAIIKTKYPEDQAPAVDSSLIDYLFKNHFYVPMLNEARAGNEEMTAHLSELIGFSEMVNEAEIKDLKTALSTAERNDPEAALHPQPMEFDDAPIPAEPNNDLQLGDPANVSNFGDASTVFPESARPFPAETLYEIAGHASEDGTAKRLYVFTSPDKKRCYEFHFDQNDGNLFYCSMCWIKNEHLLTGAQIIIPNGKSALVYFGETAHVCQPIKYAPMTKQAGALLDSTPQMNDSAVYQSGATLGPENFLVIEKEYRGKTYPRLLLFNGEDRTMGYEYGWNSGADHFYCYACRKEFNSTVSAKFINEKTQIKLGENEHKCEMKKLNADAEVAWTDLSYFD